MIYVPVIIILNFNCVNYNTLITLWIAIEYNFDELNWT